MQITQEFFEARVPAFRDCGERIFASVLPIIGDSATQILQRAGVASGSGDAQAFAAAACLRGAWRALPQLDLILTDNGLAVVSNQNVAPASQSRTMSLREQLRREKSDAFDAWLETVGVYKPDSLLYSPTLARRYGLPATTYEEELDAFSVTLSSAAEGVKKLISPEMYADLLDNFRDEIGRGPLLDLCRHYMAAYALRDDYGMRLTAHRIKQLLIENADDAPYAAYRNSSTYKADTFQPYQNKREDPTYFFC